MTLTASKRFCQIYRADPTSLVADTAPQADPRVRCGHIAFCVTMQFGFLSTHMQSWPFPCTKGACPVGGDEDPTASVIPSLLRRSPSPILRA